MSRQASAHLSVTVADEQLVQHIKRVSEAKAAWESMALALGKMSNVDPATAPALKGLGDSMAGFSKVKAGGLDQAFEAIGKVAGKASDFDKLQKSLAFLPPVLHNLADATKKWADQLTRADGYVGKLDDRVQKLISSQQATERHLEDFEGKLKQANDALKQQGAEILKLVQGYAGFNKAVDKAEQAQKKVTKTQVELTERVKGMWGGIQAADRAFIRFATTLFIAGQWVKHLGEAFREAAVEMDLTTVMSKNVAGWGRIMEDTQKATRGMVSNLQILKSGALMSSFGIPIENLAENMGIIQKLAVRTGQDTQYMFDSLARGVSRLSPAILDNLGLQIKLNDAYATYAAQMNKSVDSMDAFEKKQAVLAEVMRQATDLTQGIDPAASYQARLDKMSASIDNWWNKTKGAILAGLALLSSTENERLGMIHDLMRIRVQEIEKYGQVVTQVAKDIWVATEFGQKNIDRDRATAGIIGDFAQTVSLGEISAEEFLAAREKQLIAEGKIYDLAMLTVEEEKKIADEKGRQAKLMERLEPMYRRQKELLRTIADVSGANGPFQQFFSEGTDTTALGQITAIIANAASGWDRLDQIRENMVKIKSDNAKFDQLYKAELSDAVKQEQRKLQVLTEQANQGNIYARAILAAYDTAKFFEGIEARALATTAAKYAVAVKLEEKDRGRLLLAERNVYFANQALNEQTGLESVLESQKKLEEQLAAEAGKYAQMQELALIWGKEDAKYTAAAVREQAQVVVSLSEKLRLTREIAELAQFTTTFVKDQSFWTTEMKKAEASRLAGGMSQAQIQAELVHIQQILNGELEWTKMLQGEIRMLMAEQRDEATAQAGLLILMNVSTQARMNMLAARAKQLKTIFDMLGGGGRGGGRREAKQAMMEVETDINTTIKNIDEMFENTLVVRGQEIQKTWVWIGDTLHYVGQTIKDIGRDMISVSRLGQDETFGLFRGDAKGALTANEEAIQRLMELAEKGGWTSGMIGRKNELEFANEAIREHIKLWTAAAQAMYDYGAASDWAYKHAEGILGDDVLRSMDALARNLEHLGDVFTKALEGQAGSYDLLGAGLNIVRSFTAEYIKDLRARAAVEMVYNGAMAWAAYPNVPKMIAHGIAATMFGAVAGGAVRLPGQARGDDRRAAERTGGPLHLHLYSEMAMTDAERGALVDRALAQAAAEGRI